MLSVLDHAPPRDVAPYHYEPFQDEKSIRVLMLLPSTSLKAEIHVKLKIAPLTKELYYEALSYTWGTMQGDYSMSSTIFCDGSEIKVTRNCEDALRRLRLEEEERVLWVDAICINQKDNDEKSVQVAFMGAVYGHAAKALIWLGDASEIIDTETGLPISDLFFNYLPLMADEIRAAKAKGEVPANTALYKALTAQGADFITTKNLTPLIQGFLDVVRRPWWERVWVVQEAALARSATVICGGKDVDHSNVGDLWSVLAQDNSHDSGLMYSLLDGFKHHMSAITCVRERLGILGPARALLKVLDRCRRLQSTDRRDRVYAMLGMFGDFQAELPQPNYGNKSHRLFEEMTIKFLTDLGGLRILANATNAGDDPNISSWAVDFSQRPKFHTPIHDDLYHASGHKSKPSFKVSDDFRILRIMGKCVDRLKMVSKAPVEGYYNPYIPQKAILGYQQSCRVGQLLNEYPTGEDLCDVLWRTMCWDVDANYQCPAAPMLRKPFQNFRNSLLSGKEVEVIELELLDAESYEFNDICVHSMPLCITANGYLASVPWTAEAGDCVIIFAGGELPFILRKDPVGEHYRFIGACYIHGIMHGEVFRVRV